MIGLITDNWRYKLGSVGLAGLLWMGVVEEPELGTSVLAPIQYRNLPKDLEMSSDVQDKVHLEVRGPSSKLTGSMLADTSVLLDLSAVKRAGDRTFPIDVSNLTLPSGVTLDRSVPAQVRLHFERRQTREVPVSIRIGQSPPAGYEVVSQRAEPATLRITGPETHVAVVEAVETDSIDLSDMPGERSEVFPVHAYLADPQVRFDGDGRVKVHIQLRKSGSPAQ